MPFAGPFDQAACEPRHIGQIDTIVDRGHQRCQPLRHQVGRAIPAAVDIGAERSECADHFTAAAIMAPEALRNAAFLKRDFGKVDALFAREDRGFSHGQILSGW